MNIWIQNWRTSIIDSLTGAGIGADEVESEADFILSHILGISRGQLYFYDPSKQIGSGYNQKSGDLDKKINEIIRRRCQREPLQHILGCWEFYGYDIEVNRDVLVPRPETEGLVEIVSDWISRQEKTTAGQINLLGLDWGTGSGCISLALAHKHPSVQIMAVDISEKALQTAAGNIRRHGLDSRIQLIHNDGLSSLDFEKVPDFIVSNPPYIPEVEIIKLAPEVREFDPHMALCGGYDGLDPYRQIALELGELSDLPQLVAFEIGWDQGQALEEIFRSYGEYYDMLVRQDLYGRDRYWVMQRK